MDGQLLIRPSEKRKRRESRILIQKTCTGRYMISIYSVFKVKSRNTVTKAACALVQTVLLLLLLLQKLDYTPMSVCDDES